jgi:transposase
VDRDERRFPVVIATSFIRVLRRPFEAADAGIEVSLKRSSVCVVDGGGEIVVEAQVTSEPEALVAWLCAQPFDLARIGLEAGLLSQWLFAGLRDAGFAAELLETRHVRAAFKTMPVKTDKKDARGIAQLMRLGWFKPVHCTSLAAQETRALLTARKLLQAKRHDVEMNRRGVLRGFGLKVGPTTPRSFEGRVRELVEGHPTLVTVAEALPAARAELLRRFKDLEKRLVEVGRADERGRRLTTVPPTPRGPPRGDPSSVGNLVALTFVAAIDDPTRFRSSW